MTIQHIYERQWYLDLWPIYWQDLPLIPDRIDNYINYTVCDGIKHQFTNFYGAVVRVNEFMVSLIYLYILQCTCYYSSMLGLKLIHFGKRSPESGTKLRHYNDVIMGTIASQITSLTIVYSTVYSDTDQRKYQSSASLAFLRGIHRRPVNSPHKCSVTRKMFPFDDVIMIQLGIGSKNNFNINGHTPWYLYTIPPYNWFDFENKQSKISLSSTINVWMVWLHYLLDRLFHLMPWL